MSQKQQIYQNYLDNWHRKNPDVVQPEVFGGMSDNPMSGAPDVTALRPFSYEHKRNSYGHALGNFELSDGRVVEMFTTTSGAMNMCAVFPDMETFRAYRTPMSSRVYFEEW